MKGKRLIFFAVVGILSLGACGNTGEGTVKTSETETKKESRKVNVEVRVESEAEESETYVNVEKSQNTISAEEAYNTAVSLTKDDLTGSKGKWYYKNIRLLSEDCDWIDDPLNKNGNVNQSAIYCKMAMLLEGFQANFNDYKDYSEMLLGFIPDTKDEFATYADNAMRFIVTSDQLIAIMHAFEEVSCVEGTFDYDAGSLGAYEITIEDLSQCANELQISEEMLGYTIAMLSAYAPEITFENNGCYINYEDTRKQIEALGENDFVVLYPLDNSTVNILDELNKTYGKDGFYYIYYDASADPSKEDVVETERGIHIGDTKSDVFDAYGNTEVKVVDIQNNAVYQTIKASYDASVAGIMRTQCISKVAYSCDDGATIEFYFDEYDQVSWLIFYN